MYLIQCVQVNTDKNGNKSIVYVHQPNDFGDSGNFKDFVTKNNLTIDDSNTTKIYIKDVDKDNKLYYYPIKILEENELVTTIKLKF